MVIFTIIPAWIWIAISAIFFAVGEFISKKFAISPGWTLFLTFIIVDIISASAWIPAIVQKNQLSITGVVWSIVSLIATVLIGILVFNEKFTLTQSIGLAIGFVSVILLSMK